jgi:multidrug resistance efflux pump
MAMKPIVKIAATGAVVLAAVGMIAYKYVDYIEYPWTRNGLVRAQVIQIVPRVSGELVRVPIRNNQLVKKGDLLFEIDPRTFQDEVNFASAQLANMKDVISSLVQQAEGMRDAVRQSESAVNEAKFEVESYAANVQNAKVQFERAAALVKSGVSDQREYDNSQATFLMAEAQLNGAKSHVNQAMAALERSKADLARSLADLGVLGEDNPRLRRAAADLKLAQQNLEFTKVSAPEDGYITNLQLRTGDSAVANQPIVAVIEASSFYVEAFFRETFVGNIQPGDRAVVTLMGYPDTPLQGRVESIGWGIAQQNGSTGFQLLPSVKPTFEWIRLAQRIPVVVYVEKVPDPVKLRAGTTASVLVMTGTSKEGSGVPPVPRALQ